ncbi:MAG TPA: DUF308 domain-containing protein [Noviherbaspirillum sp.]|nr:DUF308 domain-containing protein [Noviherbaspirillum sp.]
MMNDTLVRSWWILALRGALAILFGALALLWPGLTLLALTALFAAYALLGGVVSVAGALRSRRSDDHWWLPLMLGIVGIAAAVIAIVHPGLTALVLVLVIGANALVSGVLDIVMAIRLRRTISDEWLLGLSGAASVVFGILVFLFPAAGALALVWLIALYAAVTGVLLLGAALRLRARMGEPGRTVERRHIPDRRISAAHT